MSRLIGTFFYIGHMRPAPGTWGSLAALPVAYLIIMFTGWIGLLVGAIVAYVLGIWATATYCAETDNHDPSEIVIDEVAGQCVALLPVAYGVQMMGVSIQTLWPGWVAAFVLFRLFDITKPGPVGWADRRKDATGVMLDDIIAGVMAAIGVVILASLYHGFFM